MTSNRQVAGSIPAGRTNLQDFRHEGKKAPEHSEIGSGAHNLDTSCHSDGHESRTPKNAASPCCPPPFPIRAPSPWDGDSHERGKTVFHIFIQQTRRHVSCRWSPPNLDVSDDAVIAVNASILKAFRQSAMEAGILPIVAYLPGPSELERPASPLDIGKRVVQKADFELVDLVPCLLKTTSAARVVPPGNHYSREANFAIADCLRTVVRNALTVRKTF